ncbi:PHD finger protein ALFIN-LIKE 1 [Cocos nucifera]|uniref:PHD finger protein ALFIN-LIKE n=1 Tax=Cocos nucifera TaxID=13894 RepID=A0A8K0ISE4_COCNU|nr:PHD finger protein ALFIN-LIKE 1 [Cocos nucifera]
MDTVQVSSAPRTVEEIYKDYSGRRAAVIRALTADVDEFYALCDPEKENLCLYGHPSGMWEVTLPAEEVPPELPEPALGINFARDGMNRKDWLSLVAVHSDSWLLSIAFFFGARFNGNERIMLLEGIPSITFPKDSLLLKECLQIIDINGRMVEMCMINELPTVFEVVTDGDRKPAKDKSGMDSGSKSKLSTKRSSDGQLKNNSKTVDEEYSEEDDEHSETLCGICGSNYSSNEFWIACDICERWFHGKCVKITPAKAESIKQYKCPSCSTKRGRQ